MDVTCVYLQGTVTDENSHERRAVCGTRDGPTDPQLQTMIFDVIVIRVVLIIHIIALFGVHILFREAEGKEY